MRTVQIFNPVLWTLIFFMVLEERNNQSHEGVDPRTPHNKKANVDEIKRKIFRVAMVLTDDSGFNFR